MRYFFHVIEKSDTIIDQDGLEFDTPESARREAEFSARELLANAIRSNVPPPTAIRVSDGKDREVAVVRLAELVPSFDQP